ncbi:MAG TPA: macro domain-containing protein [Myxococcota bacterium]
MLVRVKLVDVNPKMIAAWRESFEGNPEVEIIQGSMLEQNVSAWVTPTNSKASMDGGLDGVIKRQIPSIEKKVQTELKRLYGSSMPVGTATCVETGVDQPRFLISTPTMVGSSDDVGATLNVALACCAAFQAVHMHNAEHGGQIRSIALPGLGAATGRTPVEICADLMWTAYNLFREKEFSSYAEMRAALEEILGDLGSFGDKMKTTAGKAAVVAATAAVAAPAPKELDDDDADDFDDEEDDDDTNASAKADDSDDDDDDDAHEDDDDEDEDEDDDF